MFENPNTSYWANSNQLTDRKVFHCANQMKPYVRGSVIDLGAGIGTVTDFFCKDNPSVTKTLCIDFSEVHEKELRGKGYEFKKINLDIPHYDIESELFDTVISSDVAEHVLSPFAYLSEAHRILKKGGYLILSVPDAKRESITVPHINFFTPLSASKLLQRVGFEKYKIKRIYNGVISPEITFLTGKIPLLNETLNYGCYYVAQK